MPARLSDALPLAAAAPRPRHTPAPGLCRQPATSRAEPHRQAPQHMAAWLAHQSRGAARDRPIQARNNSGQYPLSPASAKPLLSRADLLPGCYQEALPGTPNYPYLYSNCCCELGGSMGIRTPGLLHAMKATPSPPPALTRRDQPNSDPEQRRATQNNARQRSSATQDTPAQRSPSTGHAASRSRGRCDQAGRMPADLPGSRPLHDRGRGRFSGAARWRRMPSRGRAARPGRTT
jgi:hypothetical protein